MAKMRGELADAIRANRIDQVDTLLAEYFERDKPDYLEKIRDKRLKDAEALALSIQRKNQKIIDVLRRVRVSRR